MHIPTARGIEYEHNDINEEEIAAPLPPIMKIVCNPNPMTEYNHESSNLPPLERA